MAFGLSSRLFHSFEKAKSRFLQNIRSTVTGDHSFNFVRCVYYTYTYRALLNAQLANNAGNNILRSCRPSPLPSDSSPSSPIIPKFSFFPFLVDLLS